MESVEWKRSFGVIKTHVVSNGGKGYFYIFAISLSKLCFNCNRTFFFFNSESVFSKSYFLRRLFRVICTALNKF